MPRSIVIVGTGGRLGSALLREWRLCGEQVTGFNRAQLDLGDVRAIHDCLEPLAFDVLVNCAAQTNVDRCEREPEQAFRINSASVGILGEICARKKARCIHISTDYVFDGTKRTPYHEEDEAKPISQYGESKLRGETALLAASERHLAVRVSWVFGPDRASFVDQILQRALDHDRVEAIADKVSVPTYTLPRGFCCRCSISRNSAESCIFAIRANAHGRIMAGTPWIARSPRDCRSAPVAWIHCDWRR